jgi:hypothetical protein
MRFLLKTIRRQTLKAPTKEYTVLAVPSAAGGSCIQPKENQAKQQPETVCPKAEYEGQKMLADLEKNAASRNYPLHHGAPR